MANTGTTAATVSNVAVTGDFTQTNSCTTIAVGGSCTVTVGFSPTAAGSRTGAVTVTSNANNSPTTIALSGSGIGTNTNIAAGRPATASSSTNSAQLPANAVDGDTGTYWESTNGAFPQWLQVDLGATTAVGKLTLDLPPLTSWAARTQTLSVQGSADGTTVTTIVPSTSYTFDPATGNTVSITLPAGTSTRYVRVTITANTGWAAGQVSELQVFPSGMSTPSATLTTSPSTLTFGSTTVGSTASTQPVTITNSGTASAAVSAISATGDFTQTNTCGTSIAAGASCSVTVSFRPTAAGTRTGSLTVTSSASNSPTTVALSGTGTSAATASLSTSPASLTFGSTTVGAASAAQTVTVSNTGGAAAGVSSVGVSGDYAQTNTCGTSIAAGGSCTVSVTFHPTVTGTRTGAVTVTGNATNSPTSVSLTGTGAAASTTNLALHAATAESSHTQTYASPAVTDGDATTYWESANGAFPQWVQVDLGSAQSINTVVLKLPPATAWATRTQTLSVLGSTDGTNFSTTLVPSATYTFDPSANSNTVPITFTAATTRYVRINITANSSQPGGQLSELEVYGAGGGGGGSASLTSSPTALSFASTTVGASSATQTVTVSNTGSAAATVSSVTATGDFTQTNTCSTVAAGGTCTVTVTFHPSATGARTGSLSVLSNATNSPSTVALSGTGAAAGGTATLGTSPSSLTFASTTVGATSGSQTVTVTNSGTASAAVSAVSASGDFGQSNTCVSLGAGGTCTVTVTFTPTTTGSRTGSLTITSNASNSPTTVALSGTGAAATGGSDQAAGKPITASSVTQTFVAGNANDGNLATYWEGSGFPSTLAVDMGANVTTSSVVVKLNPDPSWGTRTQTIQVLGHSQTSTTFTELVPAAVYTFTQGTNVVTIPVSATVSAVELSITTNSGAGGGQVAELQVIGVPAPNPDLTITSVTASPAAPVETDSITESAVVRNIGTAPAWGDQRQLLPRGHQGGDGVGRGPRGGSDVDGLSRHRDAGRRLVPADRQGRRGQRSHRAE